MVTRGTFLTVEGGEGVGKSLFTSLLKKLLEDRGIEVLTSHEPGGTPVATAVREIFLAPPGEDPLEPLTELYLVSACRAQHVGRIIRPALERGQWVLCDRYYDSTRVYQGVIGGLAEESLEPVLSQSVDGVHPDLTLLLDCPADVAQERIGTRSRQQGVPGTRFDEQDAAWHEKLRTAWNSVALRFPDRIRRVDASRSPEQVLQQAAGIIEEKLGVSLGADKNL